MKSMMILRAMLAVSLFVVSACGEETETTFVQPNIILISAGDLSVEDLGTYGGPIPTPNLDRLAAIGAVFERSYAAAGQPGPSRAALASGRYPQRFGYHFDTGPVRKTISERTGIPDDVILLPERLKTLGYDTSLYGSWHLGAAPNFYPMFRGYDTFWGTLGAKTAYTQPRRSDAVFAKTENFRLAPSRSRFNSVFAGRQADTVSNTSAYLTDDMGDEIIKRLRQLNAGNSTSSGTESAEATPPVFIWAAFHAPREPLTALKADMAGFEELGGKERQVYAGMITALDRNIGKILDALEGSALLQDTLIIFTADRGCDAAAKTCPCATLRGGAPSLRDGALRVPLIISRPATLPQGVRISAPVIAMDVVPTVIHQADPNPRMTPEFDGMDLAPSMNGNDQSLRRRTLFWDQFPYSAAVTGSKKVLFDGTSNQAKYYDLERDPSEETDIAEDEVYASSELETQLDVWRQGNTFPGWEGYSSAQMQLCGREEYILRPKTGRY